MCDGECRADGVGGGLAEVVMPISLLESRTLDGADVRYVLLIQVYA